jgi:hypothetical protein
VTSQAQDGRRLAHACTMPESSFLKGASKKLCARH